MGDSVTLVRWKWGITIKIVTTAKGISMLPAWTRNGVVLGSVLLAGLALADLLLMWRRSASSVEAYASPEPEVGEVPEPDEFAGMHRSGTELVYTKLPLDVGGREEDVTEGYVPSPTRTVGVPFGMF